MNDQFAIAIHGGAGTLHRERFSPDVVQQYEKALRQALQAGLHILQNGGRSLDALETAVRELEECPFFNAGRGAVFNADGGHSLDAAIMDGRTLAAGAVAGISGFKSPIQVARAVMEKTRYVLLSGQGAADFARDQGFEEAAADYFYTDLRYHQWKKKQENELDESADLNFGTVGAVALDKNGNLAAATSTGGLTNKRYGRVGDSPIIGSGTYANNNTCAVSCTGDGEHFIRSVVAYDISCLIEYKQLTLRDACAFAMQRLQKIDGTGGLIAIDRWGNIQMPYNSEGMYRACAYTSGEIEIKIFE
ncbi:beta-aspartyl-peptidase [Niastella koreensis]|uniref:Isoaspartyl peptidase n=2 Tax=Niastella koreensis TaxID=354356 RepID=G8TGS3_NIAKG|nr:isoaspartyl peptidase/L-asparaginase [Niastella koreensis]AEV99525.1 Beta-aspartyl-peptidase [Niastella koreensis GR20-10]OQP50118.1 beta-aspartyl-peptidase [Niastella koreensis]